MKEINLDQLAIEVTRKCNMNCPHCLRGSVQNQSMTEDIINHLLCGVRSISTVLFTGGEPTLNLPIIRYFLDQVRLRNICIGSFSLITNGKENQMELANLLLQNGDLFDEPEYNYLAISKDRYHEGTPAWSPLEMFGCYSHEKEFLTEEQEKNRVLINEGRAVALAENKRDYDYGGTLSIEIYKGSDIYVEDMLYVCANGHVTNCCDCSFERADMISVGDLKEETLPDLLERVYEENYDKEEA